MFRILKEAIRSAVSKIALYLTGCSQLRELWFNDLFMYMYINCITCTCISLVAVGTLFNQ